MVRIKASRSIGRNSLVQLMSNVEHNMLGRPMQAAVKDAWRTAAAKMVADYKTLVPRRSKPYPYSHPNFWKYPRKPGRLRNSVRAVHARRVPPDALPRAYIKVESWPYRVLLHGTVPRKIKKGPRAGQSTGTGPDAINEQRFYTVSAPAAFQRAAAQLLASGVIRDPFRRRR